MAERNFCPVVNNIVLAAGIACIIYYLACGLFVRFGQSALWIWPLVGCLLIARYFLAKNGFIASLPRGLLIAARSLIALGAALFIAVECMVVSGMVSAAPEGLDYLIILGARVEQNGPSPALTRRLNAAMDYLEDSPDTVIIASGGQGSDEPMSEAQAMFDELVKLGIEPERIWIEDKATSTRENLEFALDLIEQKTGTRPDTLGVVSSEYHLFRAGLLTRECGVEFVGIPAKTSRASQLVNHLMREVAGVWQYLILGG